MAHVAKRTKPNAEVIYNDFDDYHKRLQLIPETNQLRRQLADILGDSPSDKKLDNQIKQAVLACVESQTSIDMLSVSSWLLFSGKHAADVETLKKMTLYNCIRRSDYDAASDYLDGLMVVKKDFEALLRPYLNDDKCLLLLDPPYTSTTQGMYANSEYFGMIQFLRLMRLVRPPFIFFGSTRSEMVDYLDFAIDKDAKYEDNLIYKL